MSARAIVTGLLSAIVAGAGLAPPATAHAAPQPVTVMTRNVYLGTGLTRIFAAPNPQALVQGVTTEWANVVATDFPTRARALADEIRDHRPDLVGLQEVQLYREQRPADLRATPNATTQVYDFLALLRDALAARGLRYSVVTTATNVDVEAPRADPGSATGLTDVRLTDRDVILRNDERAGLSITSASSGRFPTQLVAPLPSTGQALSVFRGFNVADVRLGDRRLRFFNTHLEPLDDTVQVAQGNEALAGPLNTTLPAIIACDCNSPADGSGTPTYANLIVGGFTDTWGPLREGETCCQAELLDNRASQLDKRIDLVLYRDPTTIQSRLATRSGIVRVRLQPPPLWASDHAGVVARLVIR